MATELKPCPFCGGEAFVKELFGNQYIECKHKSKCLIAPNTWLQSSQPLRKQIRAWNRRAAKNTPCDLCKFNPPSSMDGKPCTMCVADGRNEDGN